MKKKMLAALLAALLLLSLPACGGKKETTVTTPSVPVQSEPTYDEPFPNNELNDPDGQTPAEPEDDGVCYLPVQIVNYTDIPTAAEERLGTGSFEAVVADYEYDEAGRLLRYATGSNILTFQYLDEIALPAVWEADVWESGEWEEMLVFKDPRWSVDRSEIWLDVAYSDAFRGTFYDTEHAYVTADLCLSDLQLDEAGRLTAATLTWDTVLGDETWSLAGYTFDEQGGLLFVPQEMEPITEKFTNEYGADGRMTGIRYQQTCEGQTVSQTVIQMDEDTIRVDASTGTSYDFTDMGNGRYRDVGDSDWWDELVFDENGTFIRSAWHAGTSGITYSYTVEYITMPRTQYVGTPVDYTNIVPVLMYDVLYEPDSQAEAAGKLQLPVAAQLIHVFSAL